MSIATVISQIRSETDILEIGGVTVNGTTVIDSTGMINEDRIIGLEADIADIRAQIDGNITGDSNLSMNNHKIIHLANPEDTTDAVNKTYVDSKFTGTVNTLALNTNSGITSSPIYSDDGYVVVGKSTSSSVFRYSDVQIHTNDFPLSVARYSNDNTPSSIILGKSRNSTLGNITANNNGDSLTQLLFCGSNNSQFLPAAIIETLADGAPSSSGVPGALQFSTANSIDGTPTARLKIDSAGNINCLNNKVINVATPTSNNDAANKAYVDAHTSTLSNNLNANNYKITSLATPTSNNDAATKAYVDAHTFNTLTSDLDCAGYRLINTAEPDSSESFTTVNYVVTHTVDLYDVGDGNLHVRKDINWGGYLINNLADPVSNQDAVTKIYVDNAISGLNPIPSLTAKYIGYGGSNNKLTGDAYLSWDSTLKALGVGTSADSARLQVGGTTNLTNMVNINGLLSPEFAATSISSLLIDAIINPSITSGGTFTRAAQLSIYPAFDLFSNNIITNAYGAYISSGTTDLSSYSSITNGYGIYVDMPSYGTNKYAGYFNGATYINGTLTAGNTTVGTLNAGTTTVGSLSSNSLSTGSAVLGPVTAGTISCGVISTSGALNMNNNKITNIAIPTNLGDAATKNYVDSLVWTYTPVMTRRVSAVLANGNAGNTNNFTCQAPWYGNNVSIYSVVNGSFHIQTNGTNGQYLACDFQGAITGNGLYSVRYTIQYAPDRAIVNVSYKPGTYGGSYASTVINTHDCYQYINYGNTDVRCEDFFTITNYPDISSVCIIWQVAGKTSSSSNYYYVMAGHVDLYRWK